MFPRPLAGGSVAALFATVVAVVFVVNGLLFLAGRAHSPGTLRDVASVDPSAQFLRRLPLNRRGTLVRIEAQDHYLNVVTSQGEAMILLRLGEAVAELAGAGGLQTHRSHWVALDAVQAHKKIAGRDLLVLSDGAEIPVARTRRQAAQKAGLF